MSERIPGQFHSEQAGGSSRQESPMEKRLKAEAEKRKSFITAERINALLPTEDLRKAFLSIKTATMSLYGLATLEKQQNVLEIREKQILSRELMKDDPTVYISAGIDIEYPLSLGARKIVMVDPIFKEQRYLEKLRQKILSLSVEGFTEEGTSFSFQFDFGEGKEGVTIAADPRMYIDEDNKDISESERFTAPEKIAAVLVFQGEDPMQDQKTIDHLQSDGVILTNRLSSKWLNEFLVTYPDKREVFGDATSDEKRKMLAEFYQSKGFESLQLDSFEDNYASTFLRKLK